MANNQNEGKRKQNKQAAEAVKARQEQLQASKDQKDAMEKATETQKKLLERMNEEFKKGNVSLANAYEKQADKIAKAIEKGGGAVTKTNLQKLTDEGENFDALNSVTLTSMKDTLDKQIQEAEKTKKETLAALNQKELTSGLKSLNDKIALENKAEEARAKLGRNDIQKRLKDLGSVFGSAVSKSDMARAAELKEQYKIANDNLQKAMASGNPEEIALAQEQVNKLEETVKTEEDRREQKIKADEANSLLKGIQDNVKDFNSKLGDFMKGGSVIGGLIGLALMMFDPERFKEIVIYAIDQVMVVVDFIKNLFEGDIAGAFETFKENLLLFGTIIGGLLLYFGPGLIGAALTLFNTIRTVGLFLQLTAFPALVSGLTSLGVMMGFTAGTVGVIAAPVLAIIAALGLLYVGFNALRNSLGPGAGIIDTLKVAALYLVDFLSMLVNAITFIPRKIIGLIGPAAAKFLFGDDVDTSMFDAISDGLRTDRGAEAAAEIRAKNEAAEAERLAQEQLDAARTNNTNVALTDPNAVANMQLPPELDSEAIAAALGQAQTMTPIVATRNTSNVDASSVTQVVDMGSSRSSNALALT